MKHEIEFIIKSNKSLAENKRKGEIDQLLSSTSIETIFMKMINNKINEPYKFVLNLSKILDLSSNKHIALQNLSIYYTWKNKRRQYKNNKLKIIAPT